MLIKDTDAAWLAGILDGEGTLMIAETKPKTLVHGPSFEAQVAVVNTDKRIVDRCKEIADGAVMGPVGRGNPGKWKPAFRWCVKRRKATIVLRATIPYLISKSEQAAILLYLANQTNYGAYPGQWGRKAASQKQIVFRRQLRLAVQCLNHRGGGEIPEEKKAALDFVRRETLCCNYCAMSERILRDESPLFALEQPA